jgi:7-carboxy-7-deazaguanine synthase
MSVEGILTAVNEHSARFVVVTGGEPMIAKGMHELISALRGRGKHVTVETAGTIGPGDCIVDLASVSPKLSNSTPDSGLVGEAWVSRHEAARLQPEILRQWIETAVDFQLKFVVSNEADLEEARSVIESIGRPVPAEKILLMPEGITVEAMRARYPLLIEASKTHGYRLSPRLHIEWFGNKRGT